MIEFFRENLLGVTLTILGMLAKMAMSNKPTTFGRVVRHIIVSIFVGATLAAVISGLDYAPEIKGAVIGLAVLVAEDILRAFIRYSTQVLADPEKLIKAIKAFFRSKL